MANYESTFAGETLNGSSAADTLAARHDNVIMNGSSGDDNYIIEADGAMVVELANEGWDTIFSNIAFFSIADLINVEELRASNGIGGQTIIGNSRNNIMSDGDNNSGIPLPADRIEGGAGNDAIYCDNGSDTLVGGTGNDRYFINDTNPVIVELAGEGIDTIHVSMTTFSIENMLVIENLAARTHSGHTLTGNIHNNTISGGAGNDFLYGGDGNDQLYGKGGSDTLNGGSGDDVYALRGAQNGNTIRIVEAVGGGTDTVKSGLQYFSLRYRANVENLVAIKELTVLNHTFVGNKLANVIKGYTAVDVLNGMEGRDELWGHSGKDRLYGGSESDTLIGGRGADRLSGGTGRDFFKYDSYADSRVGAGNRDLVTDFAKGDRFDFLAIDANTKAAGNNAFSFIGASKFSNKAGQLHYRQDDHTGTSNDRTYLEADLNGNGIADFQIAVTGLVKFAAGDFIL
jgi:Ca2+-binding RTX toxin-like protein